MKQDHLHQKQQELPLPLGQSNLASYAVESCLFLGAS